MELLHLHEFIGDLAVITTILQFLSGALVCKQYVVNRTTGESSPLPFICCVLSCAIWLFYGVVKRDDKIVLVNFVGIALMSGYTVVFYIFTFKKSMVLKQCATSILIFIFIIWFVKKEDDELLLRTVLGILASFFTLVTISAPMSKLIHVIKTRSTECLPFPLILMSFLVSSLWTLYGYIIQDYFLQTVNVVGAVLAIAQLSLFLIYPNNPQFQLLPKYI
ncbi:sugar transporter SWEET1 [Pectinophora gossypiella]|uniref:sugar transporter SWEET1 n=1 Tax=Pectinophora gossypiella TaxID=13191 RepID=UPI00214F1C6D|nr:sugar transporter SWEET1 [Pectinophora gossypiella]